MTEKTHWQKLTEQEAHVLLHKGTEAPFSGEYCDHVENGIYQCRQCHALLYNSMDKFHSGCGWPSFDDDIKGAVIVKPDADGKRSEIICAECQGHLGHIFSGERFTEKNTRHCVNSLSLRFVAIDSLYQQATAGHPLYGAAVFAAGCFWGVEHKFAKQVGVIAIQVGYTGGSSLKPSYQEVCQGTTGHAEAVRLIYHRQQTDYQQLVEFFFQMHDATQRNRQGVDIGNQYRSAIFYVDQQQQHIAEHIKQRLIDAGIMIVTEIVAAREFWPAEDYHQRYYVKHPQSPFTCG